MGCSKSSSKREVSSHTILPQDTRKTSNRQPNFTPKTTGKKTKTKKTQKTKISRRKEIIKIQAEIKGKEKPVRNTNTWRLNNMCLNNQQVTEEIKREIKKFLETNDNKNMTTLNLWDATKTVLRRKFIAIQSYPKKQEKHQTDNLTLHLKQPEKEEQKTPLKLVEGKKP